MLTNNSRSWLVIGMWFAAVTVILATAVATGARPLTIALLVPLCAAPLAIALLVSRRTQSPTLVQQVHAVHIAKDGRS